MAGEPELIELGGKAVLIYPDDGPLIAAERDATDLIGETFGRNIALIVVPAERFGQDFYRLGSGLLGAVTQKFVNYQCRLAIVGDVSAYEAKSEPFRDFVREANRGRHIWFVPDRETLARRLTAER